MKTLLFKRLQMKSCQRHVKFLIQLFSEDFVKTNMFRVKLTLQISLLDTNK